MNLVTTAELNQPVDLNKLTFVDGFLYDTAIYKCAYLKDNKTRAKVSIFSTGKIICVGAKSFEDAKHDLLYATKRLAELHLVKPTKITVKLRNIVATGEIGNRYREAFDKPPKQHLRARTIPRRNLLRKGA